MSEVQHYVFCPRQWGLMAIEREWSDNAMTAMGAKLHERAHDSLRHDAPVGVVVERALPINSDRLGVYGYADVVEFIPDEAGVPIARHPGTYRIRPVEYKKGRPKREPSDSAQLCLEAMCLEEMLGCSIETGDLFYWEQRRRQSVELGEGLRRLVTESLQEMRTALAAGRIPPPREDRRPCVSCSLVDLCLPDAPASIGRRFRSAVAGVLRAEDVASEETT